MVDHRGGERGDADAADFVLVLVPIGDDVAGRGDRDVDLPALALDPHDQLDLRVEPDELDRLFETLHRLPVDRDDPVARLQPCLGRRTVRQNHADLGRREGLAPEHEEADEDQQREDVVDEGPGEDDRGARADALVVKGDLALGGRHVLQPLRTSAGGIGVAVHFHVAAEGDGAELPACA